MEWNKLTTRNIAEDEKEYFNGGILKPELVNDIMNPLLNYRHKITDTELQNIANNFVGGAR
nr:MAG TPA: hypothetical protein [Caudoviricetes sp.]